MYLVYINGFFTVLQCCQEQIKQTPFYVKIDCFWARDLISCVKGYFWPTWRWVNSFFDFCPFPQTFLTFFESPKKPKLPFFELGTWFFVWREVFDQHEHGSNHFLISALLHSKIALWSWAVQYIKWGLLDLFLAALYGLLLLAFRRKANVPAKMFRFLNFPFALRT